MQLSQATGLATLCKGAVEQLSMCETVSIVDVWEMAPPSVV